MHGITFSIEHMAGMCKGVWQTAPIDFIFAERNGKREKIGLVGRHDGARVLLRKHLKKDLREPLRKEVERLRLKSGGCSIDTKGISVLPDPRLIEAYLKGELNRNKSVVLMADGEFFDSPEPPPTESVFNV